MKIFLKCLICFFLFNSFCFSEDKTIFNLDENVPIVIMSDTIIIDNKDISAVGSALLEYKDFKISSDNIRINTEEKNIFAEGNIVLKTRDYNLLSDNLNLNLEENTGDAKNIKTEISDLKILGEEIKFFKNKIIILKSKFTNCNRPLSHYNIQSKKITIFKKRVTATNTSVFWKNKKILSIPYLIFSIREDREKKERLPLPKLGYNKNTGIFLKSEYSITLNNTTDASINLILEEEKKILGEINLKKDMNSILSSLSFGKTREKETGIQEQFLKKRPHLKIEQTEHKIYSKLFIDSIFEYSNISENNSKYINKYGFNTVLKNKISAVRCGEIILSLGLKKDWYDKTKRRIKVAGVNLYKKFDNKDINITYVENRQKGNTPFIYDALSAYKELQIDFGFKFSNFENRLKIKHDVETEKIIEYSHGLYYLLDCIKIGFDIKHTKGKTTWFQIKIQGF